MHLDVAIDVVDAKTDGPSDAVIDGAADALADVPDDSGRGARLDVHYGPTRRAARHARRGRHGCTPTRTGRRGRGRTRDTAADGRPTRMRLTGHGRRGQADTNTADTGTADAPAMPPMPPLTSMRARPTSSSVTSTRVHEQPRRSRWSRREVPSAAQAAGLSGTFVALLSTSTVDAKSRLGTARGWVRTDGKPFADRQEDLFRSNCGSALYYPPRLDEFGNILPPNATVT